MNLERDRPTDPYLNLPALAPLDLRSDDFSADGPLPEVTGFAQGNVSPHLAWQAPDGTQALLVACFDVDAPVVGGFVHWAAVLTPNVSDLARGAGAEGMPPGTIELLNDYGSPGWGGCYPPAGDVAHRYYFSVTALTTAEHGIDAATPYAKAQFTNLAAMSARGVLMGTYQL